MTDETAGSSGFHAVASSRGFLSSVGTAGTHPTSCLSRLVGLLRLSGITRLLCLSRLVELLPLSRLVERPCLGRPIRLIQVRSRVTPLEGGGTVTPAPAAPLWHSRVPSCPSLRTAVTIITRICAHWTHLDSFTLLIALLYICLFLSFVPRVIIIVVMLFCSPYPDAVRVLFDVRFSLNVHSLYLLLVSQFRSF